VRQIALVHGAAGRHQAHDGDKRLLRPHHVRLSRLALGLFFFFFTKKRKKKGGKRRGKKEKKEVKKGKKEEKENKGEEMRAFANSLSG
jgi:hypothetical protein